MRCYQPLNDKSAGWLVLKARGELLTRTSQLQTRALGGGSLLHRGDAPGRGQAVAVQGALLSRWPANSGVGEPQELQAEGRTGRPAAFRARAQAQAHWKGKVRTNETHQSTTDPDARLSVTELREATRHAGVQQQRTHAVLPRTCAGGESFRLGGERGIDSWSRHRRARCGAGDARYCAKRLRQGAGSRPTTRPTSSPRAENARSRLMWPATMRAAAEVPLMRAPRAIPATR